MFPSEVQQVCDKELGFLQLRLHLGFLLLRELHLLQLTVQLAHRQLQQLVLLLGVHELLVQEGLLALQLFSLDLPVLGLFTQLFLVFFGAHLVCA